ncbi:MAG: D-alanyl-D-alanine carboxypeptidase family protein [Ruminococcus flavefaciens]|nr:D-alanyl-D-alanine carboxypeptidase family protein [Ruminococcus flavefaciens]
MKRKIIPVLLFAVLCTLSACGKEDTGLENSFIVNEGSVSENTENISSESIQTTEKNGYIITTTTTTTTTTTIATDESGNPIVETVTAVPETPPETVPETPAEPVTIPPEEIPTAETPSEPSVIDYTPSTAPASSPASTAVLPADAPTEWDYNYGPAPVVYDIPGIKYIDNVLIANKSYSLPADFYPELDYTCLNQFYKLQNDASYEGLNIYLSSGFRSYDYQNEIYNNYVAMDGQEVADTYSARPGHSEHQSGLAIDVNQIDDTFIGTPEAIWLEQHCYEYGFILRYPQSKQDITGYKYESWHIRYVGTDLSYKIHAKAVEMGDPYLTLEEYFGIDSYYH